MEKLELLYAKLVFRMNTERRLALIRKLASLLRNNFSLMDALGRIEQIESHNGKKPDEPYAIAMRQWQKGLEQGLSFSDATRGWLPGIETLLLTSANVSDLTRALENLETVVVGTNKIKSAMRNAIAYPLFLLVLTFAIIIMVGVYLVPPLASVAGPNVQWTGAANLLILVSEFSINYWHIIAGVFVGLCLLVWLSLSNWTGFWRTRFDNIVPWSVYKIHVSVGWMMSLAAMVRAGVAVPDAMRVLADNSNAYLREILESALRYIANGDNLGVALANTGRNFPNNELIGDLTIYSDMNDFSQNISNVAHDYLQNSVQKIESLSNALNSAGILLVSVIIAWVVLATFQMQDQITMMLA
ncbi:MAG: type II secretion system F family protein [Alphaproteobacteria bacterium]